MYNTSTLKRATKFSKPKKDPCANNKCGAYSMCVPGMTDQNMKITYFYEENFNQHK